MLIPGPTPAPLIGWDAGHTALVGIALAAVSVPLAIREARRQRQPWLAKLLMFSLALHFVGAIAQAEVVAHLYKNSADFNKYDGQGAVLASGIRHLHLSTTGLTIPGTGAVSVATGIVYAIVGIDQLGGFFVFSWLSLLGLVFFYRAARTAIPDLQSGRYAGVLFLLPSLLYWPSQAGKEGLMIFFLGMATYGAALMLGGRIRGWVPTAVGFTAGAFIRPHEVALLAASYVVAVVFRRPSVQRARGLSWLVTVVLGIGALVVIATITSRFLHLTSLSSSSLTDAAATANGNVQRTGSGFGSSHGGWSSSPLAYPKDIVTVLLEPLPWHARSVTQVIALSENVIVLALALTFRRSAYAIPSAIRRQPFLLLAAVYSALFVYIFSALGNVGLLDRERTVLFPLLLLLLCLPARESTRAERRLGHQDRAAWDVPGVLVRPGG